MAHNSESLRSAFKYLYPDELPFLKQLVQSLPPNPKVINIGAGSGTSGLAILEAREDVRLLTIDITAHDSPFGSLYAERQVVEAAGLSARHVQLHADSKQVAATWTEPVVDMVFVDGGHEYEEAKGDIVGWLRHIKRGGVMAVHDYKKGELQPNSDGPHPMVWEGVDQAVDEILLPRYAIITRVDSLIAFRIE